MIYLDYAATTPLCKEARAAIEPFLNGNFGDPSSLHHLGKEAKFACETAREQLAALLNARPAEIVFTSGATEGNNWALRGVAHIVIDSPATGAITDPSPEQGEDL